MAFKGQVTLPASLFCDIFKHQKYIIMKEFLEIMGKDIYDEHFTSKEYVVYGIIAPLVLVLGCWLAGGLA